ncbi:MAG TPA: hypothetical protein VGH63_09200 [Polyangia bacterium]
MALALTGCSFVVNGLQSGTTEDNGDLAMDVADLAVGDGDIAMSAPGDMAQPPPADLAMPPDLATPIGLLTGTIAQTTGTTIDLSAEGTADWAHWGTANKNSFDHKNVATPLISDFTPVVGNETITQLGTYALGFSWSDGTPTATATNSTTGVYTTGNGTGFRITVPADLTTRTLRLYCGGQMSSATVTAHLSDGSAADYTTTTMAGAGDTGTQFERTVTLVYHAVSAAQTLVVTWAQSSAGGYVHVHSATLQ